MTHLIRDFLKNNAWLLFIFLHFNAAAHDEHRPITDSLKSHVKTDITLIVFSAGNRSFQIFTEDLYQQLKKDLVQFNVKTTFYYLGDKKDDPLDNLERKLVHEKFDAFIILDFNYHKKSNANFIIPSNDVNRKENLQVYYFDESNFLAPIWQVAFKVNIDTINPSEYISISNNLIGNLRKDGIISKASH